MAIKYGYLVDPNKQFQYKNGKNLTSGYLRVFDANTDDPAPTYSNWQLTPNPQNITLDDNGRAVVICDSSKSYRLEVFSYDGELLWTIEPLACIGGGGSSVSVGVQDIISTDQSVQVDIHNGIADLSADRGDPQVIVTSSNTLTEDGQFTFTAATSRSGSKLNIVDGQVVSARQYIHFEATVALVWAGAANASTEVSLTCLDTTEKRDFDLSFAHTEYLDVSADYEVSTENTPLYVTVLNLYPGMTAQVENFSVHAVTKRYGDGSEYRAGNGIIIQTGEISVDPTVVQEKLEAGANISIVGNVISATADPQQPADWAATEGVTRILNKPDLDIYATHSEVTYGLAQKQDTISDLATIRSGAAAGATAVQPSEMDSALAGKQDVINDLSTIRSGAAKGATSVQPADLAPYAVASDVETALAGKQDVISDLSAIRSGASAGATAVQPATMNSALAGKQDVISDLSDIRSGAEAGATAVQPATMNTALAGKQDVINDLSDIRSGASAGATAVQPAEMNTALAGKQDVISDLATIRSGAAAGATAVQPATMNSALALKEDAANKSQTLDPTSTTEFPSSAATASFVNSSVATNTATFRGNFKLADLGLTYPATNAQIEAALDAHTWPVGVVPTNNDYVYVEIENPQTTGIDDVVERFKFNGTDWHYEYTLNNSSFTAAEKAAIDSGIDSAKVAIYDAHVANGDIHVTATEKTTWNAKQDAINDLSTIRSGAAAGATAVQPGDLATVATTGSFSDLTGTPTVDQTYSASSTNAQSGVAVASAISGKQDTISDLATIRSGAAAGATAVQPGDLSAVATTGAYSDLSGTPTVDQTYNSASANAQSGVAVAQAISGVNAVPASTSADSSKVLTVNSIGTPEWAAAQAPISAGSGIDITNNTVSAKVDGTTVNVNGSGQLQATQPTVDQTYNSSSANAQSGTAVAGAIAGKEDEFSAGDGLEFTTDGQGNRVLQVDTPVDIVAGPGIVIDNPDGNTLRVSVAQAEEVVLCNTVSNSSCTLSEAYSNFERIRISFTQEDPSTIAESYAFTPMTAEFYCADIENNAGHKVMLIWSGLDGVNGAGSNHLLFRIGVWQFTTSTTFAKLLGKQFYVSWTGTDTSKLYVTKVVGIHRIANN